MGKIILVMICALSLTLGACEKRETKKPSEVKSPEATGIISNKVPQQVVDIATGLLTDFGKDPIVVKAVKTQNALGQTKAEIEAMDKKWQASKKEGKTEPFMKALMDNPCAKQLKKLMTEQPFITEIFVTDNQGANVCQTGLTGDYWQGDEAKFKEVFKKGILVSHPSLEDGMNITQVSVPVLMKKRHIGTMTIGVNIDKVPGPKKAEAIKPKAEKTEAAPAVAEKVAPATEAPKQEVVAPAVVEKVAPATEAPKQEVAAPAVVEKVAPTTEEPKKEVAVPAKVTEKVEAPAQKEPQKEAPAIVVEAVEEAQEDAAKVTQQVQAVAKQTEKASKDLLYLPAQVEKVQQEAEEVQLEVEKVAAQVKLVSEKVHKVSVDSQQVLDKARNAMEQVLKARAQLRDAADQIQKSAALMTEKLGEIQLLTGEQDAQEQALQKTD
jgi:hypothetical protein